MLNQQKAGLAPLHWALRCPAYLTLFFCKGTLYMFSQSEQDIFFIYIPCHVSRINKATNGISLTAENFLFKRRFHHVVCNFLIVGPYHHAREQYLQGVQKSVVNLLLYVRE